MWSIEGTILASAAAAAYLNVNDVLAQKRGKYLRLIAETLCGRKKRGSLQFMTSGGSIAFVHILRVGSNGEAKTRPWGEIFSLNLSIYSLSVYSSRLVGHPALPRVSEGPLVNGLY